MSLDLGCFTYLVRDYDEAISWFVSVLGFQLLEDTVITQDKRWVRVAARPGGVSVLLARAADSQQSAAVGRAAGGRVAYFLYTDDFDDSYFRLLNKGVRFLEQPRRESYGAVVVFEDLYGNKWDLIEKITN
jgi:catechol 2,3-dioxygenase-like lactoylglutathione lyase family enzyme